MNKKILTLFLIVFGLCFFVANTDTVNAANPVSTISTAPITFSLAVGADNKVYTIGNECSCLFVHDVTDKANPTTIASTTTSSAPDSIAYYNNHIYVSTYNGALDTFDVSNPSSPTLVNTYTFPSGYGTGQLRVFGSHLFVVFWQGEFAGPGGFSIFDLSNPNQPDQLSEVYHVENQSGAGDTFLRGTYLYVADYFGYTFSVYDVSDMSNPVLIQQLTGINDPQDYKVIEELGQVFEPWMLLGSGNALYLTDDDIIQVYDISSSTNPTYVKSIVAFRDVEGAHVKDNILYYSASFQSTMAYYDLTDPLDPRLISSHNTTLNNHYVDVGDDHYFYVNNRGESILNIYAPLAKPNVSISGPTSISQTSATLNTDLVDTGSATTTVIGFDWGSTGSFGQVASSTGLFGSGYQSSESITGLTCGTTYYYRAFAINFIGTATTSDSTFTTSDCSSSSGGSSSSSGSRLPQAILNQILATTTPALSNNTNNFIRNLTTGNSGSDVQNLQKYLNSKGFIIVLAGPGSKGNETNFFGGLTRAALTRFQKAHSIYPSVGYFGPLTRAFIAKNP
jgi:hypothetical protein